MMDLLSATPWIILVAIASVIGTISGYLDNYATDVVFKGKYPQADMVFCGPLYLLVVIFLLIFFPVSEFNVLMIILLVIAGMMESLGSIPYYIGLEKEETTSSKILLQIVPVINLIFAWFFLNQQITLIQWISFLVIISAPIIIVLASRKRSQKTRIKSIGLFLTYGIFCAISNTLFVTASDMNQSYDYWQIMAFFFLGKATTDLITGVVMKKWRKHLLSCIKKNPAKTLIPIFTNFSIWLIAQSLYRIATTTSDSLALVSVTFNAMELVLTFFFGLLLTMLWPKFGREKLDKKTIIVHLIATAVALVGIILIGE